MSQIRIRAIILLMAGTLLLHVDASAQHFSIGPQISGFGVGGGATLSMNGFFSVSADFSVLPISAFDIDEGDINYTVDPNIAGGMIAINLHPFRNRFSLGAGLVLGQYGLDAKTDQLSGTVDVGGQSYSVQDVGSLTGSFDFKGPWPAAIIGWRGKGFNFGAGVVAIDDPEINLVSSGQIATDAQFQADLASEIQQVRDDIKLSLIPYFRIGYQIGF